MARRMRTLGPLLIAWLALQPADPAWACSAATPFRPAVIPTPDMLVTEAAWIVRAQAVGYDRPPSTVAAADGRVSFRVLEELKGEIPEAEIELVGRLVSHDDFNDHPVPYTSVRPDGRGGSCVATLYRAGAEYALMLRRTRDNTSYTAGWLALMPLNEQVRGADDAWMVWLRRQMQLQARREPDLPSARRVATYGVYSALLEYIASGQSPLGRPPASPMGILDRTVPPDDPRDAGRTLRTETSPWSDAVIDFERSKGRYQPFIPALDVSTRYALVSSAQLLSGQARDVVAFSDVGFSEDGRHAVVWVICRADWNGPQTARGSAFFALLVREGQAWRVERTVVAWTARPRTGRAADVK